MLVQQSYEIGLVSTSVWGIFGVPYLQIKSLVTGHSVYVIMNSWWQYSLMPVLLDLQSKFVSPSGKLFTISNTLYLASIDGWKLWRDSARLSSPALETSTLLLHSDNHCGAYDVYIVYGRPGLFFYGRLDKKFTAIQTCPNLDFLTSVYTHAR